MKHHIAKGILIIAPFVLSSCLTTEPIQPVAALLEQPSSETRILLESVIGDLLNSKPIKLADNVFTQKSTVVIERNQPKNSRGNLLDGRERRSADTVSLLTEAGKCYLKHDQSGNIKRVGNIRCRECSI